MKKISGPRKCSLFCRKNKHRHSLTKPPLGSEFSPFQIFSRIFPSLSLNVSKFLASVLPSLPHILTLAQKKNSSYPECCLLLTFKKSRKSIPFQQTCWNSLRCSFFILLYEFIALALNSCLLLSFSSLCCPFSWKIDENCMSFWWLEVNPFKAKPFFMAEKHFVAFVAFLHWRVDMLIYVATHSPPIRLVKKCEDAMQLLV